MPDAITERLFATPLVISQIEDAAALNAELEAAILARRKTSGGVSRSNIGGWHSEPDLFRWTAEAGLRLGRHAIELAAANTDLAGGAATMPDQWGVEGWANVSGRGHSNMSHVHGGAFWSAVYYVRADEGQGGELIFHDPRMPALRMHSPLLRFRDCGPEQMLKKAPRAGRMFLFPSWLLHSVAPWDGEGLRISIAMNLVADLKRGAQSPKR